MKAYQILHKDKLVGVVIANKVNSLDEFTISIDGRLVQYEFNVVVVEIK